MKEPHGRRLHFLGTASGLPTAERFSQTIAFESPPGEILLLDVADGASALLMRQGLDHLRVGGILISHMHADHHSGLAQLVKTMMHQRRTEPLEILAPNEGIDAIRAYLRASYLVPEWLGYEVRWRPIERTMTLRSGIGIEAVPNRHLDPARQRARDLEGPPAGWAFQSYSFILRLGERRLAYSGNLKGSATELLPHARGVDVLILELAHLSLDDLPRELAAFGAPLTLLTHVNPRYDDRGARALEERIRSMTFPGRVRLAADGMVVDLRDTLRSEGS